MPRLFRVILPVSDIDLAERFYSRVLGIAGKRVSPGRHYFDCGGTILACFDAKADGDLVVPKANPENVYFAVDDLEAAYDRAVAAGCQWIEGKIQGRGMGREVVLCPRPIWESDLSGGREDGIHGVNSVQLGVLWRVVEQVVNQCRRDVPCAMKHSDNLHNVSYDTIKDQIVIEFRDGAFVQIG